MTKSRLPSLSRSPRKMPVIHQRSGPSSLIDAFGGFHLLIRDDLADARSLGHVGEFAALGEGR